MRSFWSDPFLWIHLAGLAVVPLWLEICWLGLAVGDPILPIWLELLLVALVGIAPILWMQWQRPFYIFSLIAVVMKPEQLTEDQRRLLTLFKSSRNRVVAIAVAVGLFFLLRQIYDAAAIATSVATLVTESHWLGLLLAAIAFLGCNLFFQVPISVLGVMLTGDGAFTSTSPYPALDIRRNFTLLGFPVNKILPPVIVEPPPPRSKAPTPATAESLTAKDVVLEGPVTADNAVILDKAETADNAETLENTVSSDNLGTSENTISSDNAETSDSALSSDNAASSEDPVTSEAMAALESGLEPQVSPEDTLEDSSEDPPENPPEASPEEQSEGWPEDQPETWPEDQASGTQESFGPPSVAVEQSIAEDMLSAEAPVAIEQSDDLAVEETEGQSSTD